MINIWWEISYNMSSLVTTTIFFIYSCNCTESLPETYHVTVHIFLKEIYFKPIHRILSLDHTFFFCLFFFFKFSFSFSLPARGESIPKKNPANFFFVPCKISRDCVAAHTSFIPIWNGTSEYRKRDQFWNRKKTDKTKANNEDSQYSIPDFFPKVCNSIVKVDIREVESEATDRSTKNEPNVMPKQEIK